MSPLYDVGMDADAVQQYAAKLQSKGDLARKLVTDLLTELGKVQGSWWGARSADAQAQISAAGTSINQFHEEIRKMVEIVLQNISEFRRFDQDR